jgi:hypothetical protein
MSSKPVAVYYEHPEWFQPLFDELERRNISFVKLHAPDHFHDPSVRESPYSLVVNRVSAFPSGGSHPEIVLYAQQYLAYLEEIGVRVINGHDAFVLGASKARQADIFERLGVPYPRARVINHPSQALAAADGLNFPIVVKPNIGGSGAGIQRYDSMDQLAVGVKNGVIDMGIDHTALVQEFLTAANNEIIRVEILNGEFLYALRLPISDDSFNYCPADGCNIDNPDMQVQSTRPPESIIEDSIRILAASSTDVGGIEYLIDAENGKAVYYDINPLSNFVADARNVVGFDPWIKFVDFILAQRG